MKYLKIMVIQGIAGPIAAFIPTLSVGSNKDIISYLRSGEFEFDMASSRGGRKDIDSSSVNQPAGGFVNKPQRTFTQGLTVSTYSIPESTNDSLHYSLTSRAIGKPPIQKQSQRGGSLKPLERRAPLVRAGERRTPPRKDSARPRTSITGPMFRGADRERLSTASSVAAKQGASLNPGSSAREQSTAAPSGSRTQARTLQSGLGHNNPLPDTAVHSNLGSSRSNLPSPSLGRPAPQSTKKTSQDRISARPATPQSQRNSVSAWQRIQELSRQSSGAETVIPMSQASTTPGSSRTSSMDLSDAMIALRPYQ